MSRRSRARGWQLHLELRPQVVLDRLGAADQLHAAVAAEEQLLRAEAAVVLEAHREAVGAGVVDEEVVAFFDGGSSRCLANLSLFSQSEPTTSTTPATPCFGAPSRPTAVMWW